MAILEMIESIVVNLFSNQLYEGKACVIEKIRLRKFRNELTQWTRKYINDHDGTVLTSEDFEDFLTNHHLIENIFSQISSGKANISKDEFINNQIALFHNIERKPQSRRYDTDYTLRGFIEYFYDKINNFFCKNLSQSEKYLASKINSGAQETMDAIHDSSNHINNSIAEIKDILVKQKELDDPETVWVIYQVLSKSIKDGNISEVAQMYPLLTGKSNDLEISVSYLLGLFSYKANFNTDFIQAQKEIVDDRIFRDICRTSIYVNSWRKNRKELKKISSRDSALNSITQSLLSNDNNDFYSVETTVQNGITYINYQINNGYPNEQWIIKRICILSIFEQPVFNASENFKLIIGESCDLLDRLLILECRLTEAYNTPEIGMEGRTSLLDEARSLIDISDELANDFRSKIYELLIRAALLVSPEEADRASQAVPDDLRSCEKIDLLLLEVEIKKGAISADEIITTCIKYNKYWPFNNYLIETININKNGEKAKELIEKYIFVIDKDPAIFLIYAQLVNNLESKEKALALFTDYQTSYGEFAEYWIDKMRIQYNDEEMSSLIPKFKCRDLRYLSISGNLALVKLLVQHNKYADALDVIRTNEMIGNISPELQRLKALSLVKTSHEIEALSIFIAIFDSGNHSEEIIYYIMALSCKNMRTVSDEVLSCARTSENPQILILAASCYFSRNSLLEACSMNLKAMLRTSDSNSEVFSQYLALETSIDHSEERQIKGVDVGTVVYLKAVNGEESKVYAVHTEKVLPNEPFLWEGACQIYKETAIILGLFRKKKGESITVSGKEYVIESIEPMEAYLFRLSMGKNIANGSAKQLAIPLTSEGILDTKQFLDMFKETVGDTSKNMEWLDLYKDFGQIPITFNLCMRFVNGTYFNLVNEIIKNKDIIYREAATDTILTDRSYILSFAALIVLFKLGWRPVEDNSKFVISCSLKKIVSDETEITIRKNNRDLVSTMGVVDDHFFVVESSEEDKAQYMQDAVSFKEYCNSFTERDNTSDLIIKNTTPINIKDILGIADYDSIVIAKNEQRVLVTAEMMVAGIAGMPEIGVDAVCIIDFLTSISKSSDELLGYIRTMVDLRFAIPFTSKTIQCLENYYSAGNEETRKSICIQMEAILNVPLEDDTYKSRILLVIRDCMTSMQSESELISPILRLLLAYAFTCFEKKSSFSIMEDGKLLTPLVSDDE